MHRFTVIQFITNPSLAIGKLFRSVPRHKNILLKTCGAVLDIRFTSRLITGILQLKLHTNEYAIRNFIHDNLQNWNWRSFGYPKHAHKGLQTDHPRSGEIYRSIHEQHHFALERLVGWWLPHVILRS